MLTKFALKRPVAIAVCLIALFVFGFSSLMSTPLELSPTMSMPMFIVYTTYPGAGPEEVESLVSSRIESAVSTVAGLKTIQTVSQESMSQVALEMEYGTDMNQTNNDLQKKLNEITNSLPEECSTPIIMEMKMDSSAQSVISMSVQATGDIDMLTYLNDNVVPEFKKLSGVANVDVYGGQESYISVLLQREKLLQYGVNMDQISQSIAAADFSMPAGSVDQGDLSLALRGGVSYPTANSLAALPLTLKSGDIIHLSDVATVKEAEKDATSVSRYNGKENVSIDVFKRDSASTNGVTNAVLAEMEKINLKAEGVQLSATYNASDDIWDSLWGVIQAMLLAIVISMVILYLFLGDIRASFIVGTSMPVSVFVTLIVMSLSGMTFNMLSLGGLTIGVGMMVDNAIVVLDSCFKKRDERRSFKDAAIEGTNVVASAVMSSTITTVVVFLPISLMKGISGQMFKDAGFTIVFALTASLVSALTLVPLLFFQFKPTEKKSSVLARGLRKVEQRYGALISKSFNHKKLVVISAVVLLVASFCLLPLIGVEFMPTTDNRSVSVNISTRPGMRLENMEKKLQEIEEIVVKQPDLESYSMSGSGSSAWFRLTLVKDNKTVETDAIVETLRRETKGMVDCEVTVSASGGFSMGGGSGSVQVNLTGNDSEQLEGVSVQIKELMYQNPGIVNVTTSISDGSPEVSINVDPVKASAYGLLPSQVMLNVSNMVSGKQAAKIRMSGKDYSVRVEFPSDTYRTVSDLSGIILTSAAGQQVPLLDIAAIQYTSGPQAVQRYNGQYVVTISGQASAADSVKTVNDVTATVMAMQLPQGVTHFMGGSQQMMDEEFSAIYSALGTAIFLVFMAMAIQFNSMRFSLMVMISVPFSLIGAFLGLLLTGTSISMTSLMGMILLVGIVVNNAIVLIDYTNQLRDSGMRVRNALVKAGRSRLRPILMTTLTTVLGMIPMAVGMGTNAEMMRGMAMVVIGGLSASTILTLVLIPTFYLMFSKKDAKNPNLRNDDNFDPEFPEVEYRRALPDDLNQSDNFEEPELNV